jgi:hypothetical protein
VLRRPHRVDAVPCRPDMCRWNLAAHYLGSGRFGCVWSSRHPQTMPACATRLQGRGESEHEAPASAPCPVQASDSRDTDSVSVVLADLGYGPASQVTGVRRQPPLDASQLISERFLLQARTGDTYPVLERGRSPRALLDAIGKHALMIHPAFGSWLLLGEIPAEFLG